MNKKNTKAGARHSVADKRKLQHMHDTAIELGASCDASGDEEKRFVSPEVKSADLISLVEAIQSAIGRAVSIANQDSGSLDGDGDYDYVYTPFIYPEFAIVRNGMQFHRVDYTLNGDDVAVPLANEWPVVEPTWNAVAASSEADALTSAPTEAVKALGDGKVGGYLVRFGGKDLSGEFFTAKTYFGPRDGDGADCLFHHGIPVAKGLEHLADELLPAIKTKKDDIGIWAEVVLNMADEYHKYIYQLAEKGKLGWSSGSPGHMVKRLDTGEITRWPIAEGSLTPQPCEPRNVITPLKSVAPLQIDQEDFPQVPGEGTVEVEEKSEQPRVNIVILRRSN